MSVNPSGCAPCNSCRTFGFDSHVLGTHRLIIDSAPSRRMTAAAIFVVVLSSGPYRATVPRGHCGGKGVKQ